MTGRIKKETRTPVHYHKNQLAITVLEYLPSVCLECFLNGQDHVYRSIVWRFLQAFWDCLSILFYKTVLHVKKKFQLFSNFQKCLFLKIESKKSGCSTIKFKNIQRPVRTIIITISEALSSQSVHWFLSVDFPTAENSNKHKWNHWNYESSIPSSSTLVFAPWFISCVFITSRPPWYWKPSPRVPTWWSCGCQPRLRTTGSWPCSRDIQLYTKEKSWCSLMVSFIHLYLISKFS